MPIRHDAMRWSDLARGVAAAVAPLVASAPPVQAQAAAPAVRKKVKLTYWNWADNPVHQNISIDSVEMFNKSQNFIEVEVDATMAVMESRKKLVTSFAAGAAPDVAMMVQYWGAGLLRQRHPASHRGHFKKWDAAPDFFANVMEQVRSKPGQPICTCRRRAFPTSSSTAPIG